MKKTRLHGLRQQLKDAGQNAPISAAQVYALTDHLINMQATLVSLLETVDKMQEVQNTSHQNTNDNFLGLLAVCKRLGREVGIDIKGINEEVSGSPYNNKTRH